jgi:PPOX class probable F420-dependent enzyme
MRAGRDEPRTTVDEHGTTLASLAAARTALLTTFRRTGVGVSTPVSISVQGGRAYFVTPAGSGKAKRLAANPDVTLAPCTVSGKALAPPVPGRARLLTADQRRRTRLLRWPTTALFWSHLQYRVQGKTMRMFEVSPPE